MQHPQVNTIIDNPTTFVDATKFDELKTFVSKNTLQTVTACLSSCYYIFTYINASAIETLNINKYHKEVEKCLKTIKKNKEIYNGYNILIYYLCTLICETPKENFRFGDNFFNIEAFESYLKFKFLEMYPTQYTNISVEDFENVYNDIIISPKLLYGYFYREIYTNLNTKMFLTVCFGTLIIYYNIIADTSQLSFIRFFKNIIGVKTD